MQKTTRQWQIQDLESFASKMAVLSISMKFEKIPSCLHLKEISPTILSKTLVAQK